MQAGEGMAVAEEAPELLPLVQLGILGRGATAVPPAMTRRILELVTHLAKHTSKGAYEMIGLKVPLAEAQAALLLGMQVAAFSRASVVCRCSDSSPFHLHFG